MNKSVGYSNPSDRLIAEMKKILAPHIKKPAYKQYVARWKKQLQKAKRRNHEQD